MYVIGVYILGYKYGIKCIAKGIVVLDTWINSYSIYTCVFHTANDTNRGAYMKMISTTTYFVNW